MNHSIIVFSGKKQSGKNTLCNFLIGLELQSRDYIKEFKINDNGKLLLNNLNEKDSSAFIEMNGKPRFVKEFSFADRLKEVCHQLLNIEYDYIYGTDEQKNNLTQYIWENMPGFYATDHYLLNKSGYMTAREVIQYVGTELFRKIDDDIWVKSCLKKIVSCTASNKIFYEDSISIITDCRFPNEFQALKDNNAFIVRLARNVGGKEQHYSETALDPDVFDWNRFDGVIYNDNMSVEELCKALLIILKTHEHLLLNVFDKTLIENYMK